ncbi:MAG: hypothetical protein ACK2T7_04025, partial [Anaerolineales bacterium]
ADPVVRQASYNGQTNSVSVPAMTTAVFVSGVIGEGAGQSVWEIASNLAPVLILGAALLSMLGVWVLQRRMN